MIENVDKRVRAEQFRQRLNRALRDSGLSQSALARAVGVDRSTISQLLTDEGARLPNAHVVGACAGALGVSADWLLSLSDRPESAAELLASSLTLTEAPARWSMSGSSNGIRRQRATRSAMCPLRSPTC